MKAVRVLLVIILGLLPLISAQVLAVFFPIYTSPLMTSTHDMSQWHWMGRTVDHNTGGGWCLWFWVCHIFHSCMSNVADVAHILLQNVQWSSSFRAVASTTLLTLQHS